MIVLETRAWLYALDHYLHRVSASFEEAYKLELDILRSSAIERALSWEEHELERQGIEAQFEFALPEVLGFSIITLQYSVLEHRLGTVANYLRTRRSLKLKITDLRGDLLDRAGVYFANVIGVPITGDPSWQELRDLEFLRHIIVHRGGIPPDDEFTRKRLAKIEGRLPSVITFLKGPNTPGEGLTAAVAVGEHYLGHLNGFFERTFAAVGMVSV